MANAIDEGRAGRIRLAMENEPGLTIERLAAAMGVAKRTIDYWLEGRTVPKTKLVQLAEATHPTPEWIQDGTHNGRRRSTPPPVERRAGDALRGDFPQVAKLIEGLREDLVAQITELREDSEKQTRL